MQLIETPVETPAQRLVEGLSGVIRAVRCTEHRQLWPDGGLRRADASVLRVIATLDEIRSGDVAQRIGVDPSVVSRQLAALHADGLIARRHDPADARASLVSLTDAGRDRLAAVYAAHQERIRATLDDWTDDEILAAAGILDRLAHAIVTPPTTDLPNGL